MTYYLALVHRADSGFDVTVPDLPGCTASADTVSDAMKNITEAMRLWAEAERSAGRAVPAARSPVAVEADPDVGAEIDAGALPALALMAASEGLRQRVNVMLDKGILTAIDAAAETDGKTRSEWLAIAAIEKMSR